MKTHTLIILYSLLGVLLTGCDNSGSSPENVVARDDSFITYDGTWEVTGRTGKEDGSSEPVCGSETATGFMYVSGAKVTGKALNKSGFDYTFQGTLSSSGKMTGTLLYSGYEAAEVEGQLSDTAAKGTWTDALNACPGVWQATRQISKPKPVVEKTSATQAAESG